MRRPSGAGALLVLVLVALAGAAVVSVLRDDSRGAAGPTLGGVPLATCRSPECPEAESAPIEVGWGNRVSLAGLSIPLRLVSVVPTEGSGAPLQGRCPGEIAVQPDGVVPYLPAGRWRAVFAAGQARYGLILASRGDARLAAPTAKWEQTAGVASLVIENDTGTPLDLTGTQVVLTGTVGGRPALTATLADGEARWQPLELGVATVLASPLCRGGTAGVTLSGVPAGAFLDAWVSIPGRHELTATIG